MTDEDVKLLPIGHIFNFDVPTQMMTCRKCGVITRHPVGWGFVESNRLLQVILDKHQDCKKQEKEKDGHPV